MLSSLLATHFQFSLHGADAPRWGLTTSLVTGWGHNGPVLATKASGFGNNGWWQWVGRISSINDQYCHRIPPNADTPNSNTQAYSNPTTLKDHMGHITKWLWLRSGRMVENSHVHTSNLSWGLWNIDNI